MIDIFDKLNAAYGDQTLADSDQIKDKKFGKKQDVLNKEILDPDDPNSLKSKVDSFNGIVIDPDNVVSTDKSDIEVGSSKIPTGNAVAGALSDAMLKAGVFDISAYNLTNDQPTPYADLEAALGNNGENVPEAVRKGGMQVKFIQGSVGSSDNKYVQFRLMAEDWSINTEDWAIADEGVYVDNPEFVYVKTDREGKILWAIKIDGGIYYGAGCPQQVKDYIEERIKNLSLDEYEDIVAFLNGLEEGDKTLQTLLNEKVDKEDGMSLIDAEYASTKSTTDNSEFLDVTLDDDDKVLEGLQKDGTKIVGGDLNVGGSTVISGDIKIIGNMKVSDVSYKMIESPEYLIAWVDAEDKILFGISTNGKTFVGDADFLNDIKNNKEAVSEIRAYLANILASIDLDALASITSVNSPEFISVETDSTGKILSSRNTDGVKKEYVGFETPKLDVGGNEIENIEDPEGRAEILTDFDRKIISYRDNEGIKHENVGIVADATTINHLNLTDSGMDEFQQALISSGFKPGGKGDWSDYVSEDGDNPLCIPQPRNIALVNILSDVNLNNLSKSTTPGAVEGVTYDVHTDVEFWDMDGNYFKKPALMSGQGNSSMQFPKKNIAFDFFDSEIDGDAFAIKFGDWVPQDSWHLKAYYTDAFRCIGLATYKLYDEIVKTRGIMADYVCKKALIDFSRIGYVANGYNDLDNLALQYETGAKCFPDGFPCIVYQNGEFFGMYCWQIKKHRDNYCMKKSNGKHIHLDGTINNTTLFNGNIDWNANTGFEVRNPKDLYLMDGTKYDADTNSGELIDSTSQYYDPENTKHVTTAAVKQRIIDFSHVMSALSAAKAAYDASSKTAEDLAAFKATIETYFDIDNLVDYLIISDISRNYDGFSKNWQWLTYDGVKWWVGLYDCDGCFGGNFTGTSNVLPLVNTHVSTSQMFYYVISYYSSELNSRYKELRDAKIVDADNIISIINGLVLRFGHQNIEKEFDKWSNCPCNRDAVLNENWEFDLDENGNPQLGTANYDDSAIYNAGDSCYYAQYPANGEATYKYKAKATVTGVKPVVTFGYRDSIYRVYNWIKTSIENMDTVYSYNN